MLQSALSPLWLDLTKATIGPVIAAIVFIVGLIWRDRIERRNTAQAWFEETYITNGIDVLSAHLTILRNATIERRRILFAETVSPLSADVCRLLLPILPSDGLLIGCTTAETIIIATIRKDHAVVLSQEEVEELANFCHLLWGFAEGVRLTLLDVRIRSKKDVYKLPSNRHLRELFGVSEGKAQESSLRNISKSLAAHYASRVAESAQAVKAEESFAASKQNRGASS